MRISASALLFATAVAAAPAPDLAAKRDAILSLGTAGIDTRAFDQGDGFYHARFNETTAKLDVTFTALAELDVHLGLGSGSTPLDTRSTGLAKRETTCSQVFSKDVPTLDRANVQLANNVNGRNFDYEDWGWVHLGEETSFVCSYDKRQHLLYQLIMDMQKVVSARCGGSHAYGYDHRRNGGGAKDLSVGRTWRGDHFCDSRFHA